MDVVELRLDDDSVLLVEARPADTRHRGSRTGVRPVSGPFAEV
jgi:hypothetical protein